MTDYDGMENFPTATCPCCKGEMRWDGTTVDDVCEECRTKFDNYDLLVGALEESLESTQHFGTTGDTHDYCCIRRDKVEQLLAAAKGEE